MIKFVKIKVDRKNKIYRNINFLEDIYNLYKQYNRFLNDDFVQNDLLEEVLLTVERTSPFFWVILNDESFAGFVFLENIIGNRKTLYSAEITTCFKQEFWGSFTRKVGRKFLQYCFKKLKFKKLKGLVFKENTKTNALLKSLGMKLEAELKSETLKNGRPQDVQIFSITNNKKYGKENENDR